MSRAIKNHVKYQLDRARLHDDVASRLSSFRKVAVAYVQAFVHLILLHSIDTVGGGDSDDRDRFQQILELYLKLPNAHTRATLYAKFMQSKMVPWTNLRLGAINLSRPIHARTHARTQPMKAMHHHSLGSKSAIRWRRLINYFILFRCCKVKER